jgi:tRNA A37 threonylcarbamoyladenosine biosynthesis protein TsaE
MIWSPQQDAALCSIHDWLHCPNGRQIFRLFGYAGSGKTTLAKEIARNFSQRATFARPRLSCGRRAAPMRQRFTR